jgi:diketogulonate reductase-like aldo/keto reductase
MQHARDYTGGKIFTNQVECHLELSQEKVKAFADAHHFLLTAYSPLGHGNLLKNERLASLAEKHHATVAQICIA